MRRMIFVPILVMVAILALAGGGAYWFYNNYNNYSTDDAQVTGHILPITSPQAGQLTTMTVKIGDKVDAGQVIATVKAAPLTPAAKPIELDITSPIAGTIVQAGAVEGQIVAPTSPIAQVTDLTNLQVTAYVDEAKISDVKLNQAVDITVDAFSGTTYKGHVQSIVSATAGSFSLLPASDNASGNFTKVAQRVPVIVTLDGKGGDNIVPGMSANVTIHIH